MAVEQLIKTTTTKDGGNVDNAGAIIDHIDVWSSAIKTRSTAGRGSSKKLNLHGIKKLRELILELAVRGLLVPQAPSDEPASVLLEKIAAEKARLVEEKKIKKQKPLPEIGEDEKPFELPVGWEWVRLQSITSKITDGDHKTPTRIAVGKRMLSAKNVRDGFVEYENCDFISEDDYVKSRERCHPEQGDLLMVSVGGTIGRSSLVPKDSDFSLVRSVALIKPILFNSNYLKYSADAPLLQDSIHSNKRGGAQPCLYLSEISKFPFPMPPLAEQHRIVTKVNELMTLCDQLEQQQETSITAHQTLVETLLGTLVNAQSGSPLTAMDGGNAENAGAIFGATQAWQRIADNFDTLFTTEHSIQQLKQTILQLAVMGKLVPQDSNDEPASVLLEKIAAEKARLVEEKKIKKQKALPEIGEDEKSFGLPVGWEWCRLEDVVDIQGGITKGRKLSGRETVCIPYLSVANVQRSYLNLDNVKEVEIPVEERERYEVLDGDLLITEGGDWDKVGRTAIWRGELPYVAHQNHVFKARVFLLDQSEIWLEKYLNSPFSRDYFAGSSKQTTNLASINKTQLRGCLIAVPPAQEKNKIVSKLESIQSLCDNMLERIKAAQTTQFNLTDAITEKALEEKL